MTSLGEETSLPTCQEGEFQRPKDRRDFVKYFLNIKVLVLSFQSSNNDWGDETKTLMLKNTTVNNLASGYKIPDNTNLAGDGGGFVVISRLLATGEGLVQIQPGQPGQRERAAEQRSVA